MTAPDPFDARTHSRPLDLGPGDVDTGSRVGGPPPATLPEVTCPGCDRPMLYMLTVERDLVPELLADDQAASLLACSGRCLGDSITGGARLATHPAGPRSAAGSAPAWGKRGRALVAGPPRDEQGLENEGLLGAKIGGRPGWLQDPLEPELPEPMELVLQLPDDAFAEAIGGTYLLGGSGSFHVFAPRDGDRLDLGRAVVLTQI